MTVDDIIAELQKIPSRERTRPTTLCGDVINNEEEVSELEISWIDCSDAVVLLFNRKG